MARAAEDPAVRAASDLPPATLTLGSPGLWLPAIAVEPGALNSFLVGVLLALRQGLVEDHAPGVCAGDHLQLYAIASGDKSEKHCRANGLPAKEQPPIGFQVSTTHAAG